MNNGRIHAPKSWRHLGDHYLIVLEDAWYKAVADIQSLIYFHTAQFYQRKGIKTLFLPITTASISSPMGLGSDSKPVQIRIHGVDTYLADSMQFMLEYGCRIFSNGCYYLMPSFRGEEADERHLCQFYHSEAEIPGTLGDVIALVEEYIVYLCRMLLQEYRDKLLTITGDNTHLDSVLQAQHFPRISFREAVDLLHNMPHCFDTREDGITQLNKQGERELIQRHGGAVWVTHYPYLSVPFYQAFGDQEKVTAANADLLMGAGEVVGAGQRHDNAESLQDALRLHRVLPKSYEWYGEMKRRHPMKTSGFGMGIERFMLWLLRHDDVRDLQILPRFNGMSIIP